MDLITYALAKKAAQNISPAVIGDSIKDYFDENPIDAGASAEEAEQIQQNKDDIVELKDTYSDLAKISDSIEESELPGGGLKFEDNRFHFAVSNKWQAGEGHLSDAFRLQWIADRAKPAISWCDENGDDKAAIIGHYMANNPGTPDHRHMSFETTLKQKDGNPDGTNNMLYTRMEFPFDMDVCEIQTHSSNFTVNSGLLKVMGPNVAHRDFVLGTSYFKKDNLNEDGSVNYDGVYKKRWAMRCNNTQESGSNNGSDFEIVRYRDDGSVMQSAFFIKRSGGGIGLGTKSPTSGLDIAVGNSIRLRGSKTPESASAYGDPGTICWDADYIYVCVGTNDWKRTPLANW